MVSSFLFVVSVVSFSLSFFGVCGIVLFFSFCRVSPAHPLVLGVVVQSAVAPAEHGPRSASELGLVNPVHQE